ncbi:MAG TPA: hypothetical protein VII49_12815 [Rhizomicrobium sp.]
MKFVTSNRATRVAFLVALGSVAWSPMASAFTKAPPVSDGSSGSFDGQIGSGSCLAWINVDNGQVWCTDSGGFVWVTLPFKTITYNGQSVHAFNFTDLNMESTVNLTVYGSASAVFLAQQNISLAGQFKFQNGTIAGGVPSNGNPNVNGGPGSGVGGGFGGQGEGGQVQACNFGWFFTAGGGGGGGNFSVGLPGHKGYWAADIPNPQHLPAGPGGTVEVSSTLQGGGGGGAGGGGNYGGNYYGGAPGGNGGGSVVFSTPGTISIASTGIMDARGINGGVVQGTSGSSGGGAGGDEWFFARTGFTNAGQLLTTGGAGGTNTYPKTACGDQSPVRGPNGGDGSGGVVLIKSATIANSGTINVAGGDGKAKPNGGLVAHSTQIDNTGQIIGQIH